jgi:hypothetical protein
VKKIRAAGGSAVFAAVVLLVTAARVRADLNIYGFAQLDYIQDLDRVDPAWAATLRPSLIPTTKGIFGSDGQAVLSVRQSMLGVEGTIPAARGDIYAKFEFDLFGIGPDEEQVTMRVRHAYGQYGGFLAGQTYSLFMDIDIFPDIIDYWGPCGMVFLWNPQFRYTRGSDTGLKFSVAIEEPLNNVDAGRLTDLDPRFAGTQADNKFPDLTLQVRKTAGRHHVQLAGILRRLGYDTPAAPENRPKGSETGWGLDLTMVLKLRTDDALKLGVVYGAGIANYINDGGMDLAPQAVSLTSVEAKAVPLLGISAYYDLGWSTTYTSSIGYSMTRVDNTNFQTGGAFHQGEYASVNFLVHPETDMFYGIEYLWGRRTDNDDATGTDQRVQLSWQYKFVSNPGFTPE